MARSKVERTTSKELKPGTRVRLRAPSHVLRLTSDLGTIVGPDQWEDYYLVRLDEPALYLHADDTTEPLDVIRELVDNIVVLPSSR